jgi:hypothetical protein
MVVNWETGASVPSPAACARLELVYGLPQHTIDTPRRRPSAGALSRTLPAHSGESE